MNQFRLFVLKIFTGDPSGYVLKEIVTGTRLIIQSQN
jgi:hypothetical protein